MKEPHGLLTSCLVAESGPAVDRLRGISTDRRGRVFFTHTVDFEGDSPKAYTVSNVVWPRRRADGDFE